MTKYKANEQELYNISTSSIATVEQDVPEYQTITLATIKDDDYQTLDFATRANEHTTKYKLSACCKVVLVAMFIVVVLAAVGVTVVFLKANGEAPSDDWEPWTGWSQCTKSCGGGNKTRSRVCVNTCDEQYRNETTHCNTNCCPLAEWNHWGPWSLCNSTCGHLSIKHRRRTCGSFCDGICTGEDNEVISCLKEPVCPSEVWSAWDSWSSCSVTCGGGIKTRERTCSSCPDVTVEDSPVDCNTHCCPSAGWNDWGSWSACSVSCPGDGVQQRQRTCDSVCGGECSESSTDVQICSGPSVCPVWSAWNSWTSCSHTCGGGIKTRQRTCSICFNVAGEESSTDCSTQCCPSADWNDWESWSACSVSCPGDGVQQRQRTCDSVCGGECSGSSTYVQICSGPSVCPVWSAWNSWTSCSHTCGGGIKTRQRTCSICFNVAGEESSTDCNTQCCPSADWNDWGSWSECSVSCPGDGVQQRQRSCDSVCGGECSGSVSETRTCSGPISCPGWLAWGSWSSCSRTCGAGTKTRTRVCAECPEEQTEPTYCYVRKCCIPGSWSTWSPLCSDDSYGTIIQTRTCSGTCGCSGPSSQEILCPCYEINCLIHP